MELLEAEFDDRLKKKIGNQFCQPLVHYSSLEGKAAARDTIATAFASMAAAITNR
jgi:hypothetical protein